MSSRFDWVPIYKELAWKLVEYAYRHQDLIEIVKEVFSDTGIKMPTLEKNNQLVDIDPFTVFGLFNKGILKENRDSILQAFKDKFNLESALPSEYDGIPVLNVLNATYYRFIDERNADDIDDLWKLFVAALNYSSEKNDKNRASFAEFFSRVIKSKGNGNAKITMALYWIAPETFMNLDSRNTWYIFDTDKLPRDFVKQLPKIQDRIKANAYLDLIDRFEAYFKYPDSLFHSFTELSYEQVKGTTRKRILC